MSLQLQDLNYQGKVEETAPQAAAAAAAAAPAAPAAAVAAAAAAGLTVFPRQEEPLWLRSGLCHVYG